ncbi:hypothetical protein ACLOJK_038783 [Asimina triloba]
MDHVVLWKEMAGGLVVVWGRRIGVRCYSAITNDINGAYVHAAGSKEMDYCWPCDLQGTSLPLVVDAAVVIDGEDDTFKKDGGDEFAAGKASICPIGIGHKNWC